MNCCNSGLSLFSQRAEVAVSGKSTPIFLHPLPFTMAPVLPLELLLLFVLFVPLLFLEKGKIPFVYKKILPPINTARRKQTARVNLIGGFLLTCGSGVNPAS